MIGQTLLRSICIPLTCGIMMLSSIAEAEPWPKDTIRLIIPFSAGGTTDIVGRALAEQLTVALGKSVIVENRPGAGGNVAAQHVARSPADGHTLMLASGSMLTVNPHLYKSMLFDYTTGFVAISNVASGPMLLSVRKDLPVNSLTEFIAYAGKHDLNFGSSGIGSQIFMAAENLNHVAKISATHVPFKGESAALLALGGGHIDYMVGNLAASIEFAKKGLIKPLAVTSQYRTKPLPEVPTMAQSGLPEMTMLGWFGLVAPVGTPQPIVDRIYRATVAAIQSPKMQHSLESNGLIAVANTPTVFHAQIKTESSRWQTLIQQRNIAVDQ